MCGIVGMLHFDNRPINKNELNFMLNKIAHRGRDYAGIAMGSKTICYKNSVSQEAEIALGHRRLAIIDLEHTSAQPMFYADRQLCIVFNGEIYNYLELRDFLEKKHYTFKTASDTEVLLAAYHYWGVHCLQHLNGMFAFAIWDDVHHMLFCARDPLGIKPFYYYLSPNRFVFASESLALAHLTNYKINRESLLCYLMSMYIPTSESIFKEIHKLPPAHYLLIDKDGYHDMHRYWHIHSFEKTKVSQTKLEELNGHIENAIARQIRSDVPVGGFLSGGIDSGLIAAIASKKSGPISYV